MRPGPFGKPRGVVPTEARADRPQRMRVRAHWTPCPAAGPMRPMADATKAYPALVAELRELALLGSVNSVLGWDEQTYMPPGGAGLRAGTCGASHVS